MKDILRNYSGSSEYSNESFIGQFHEKQLWNDEEYSKFEAALYSECEKYKGKEEIPREVAWPIMKIFSYLMLSLACHSDPTDGFEIKNITPEQLHNRRERIQLVFEGFFKGEMPNQEYLEY